MRPERPEVQLPKPKTSLPLWIPDSRKLRPVWRLVPSRLLLYLLDPAHFWMLLGSYEDQAIVFDAWQIADLHDYSRIRVREKAPQIGASWLRACEAVWECMMFEDATTSFVSMDQREASEKVLYAKKLYEGLPAQIQDWIPMVRDNIDEVHWGSTSRPSRVISLPNTSALRGRKMSVVLDESDFYKDGGASAYRVAVGRIARGGRVTMNSTCFGEGTKLDLLMQGVDETGETATDPVSRARYPYTVVEQPEVASAIEMARSTLDDADFMEEYECIRGAMSTDPFPATLLRHASHEGLEPIEVERGRLMLAPGETAVMGYDVGKGSGRHPSIASVFIRGADGVWRQEGLYQPMQGARPRTLPEQHDWLREMMRRCPNLVLCPDSQGIGAHIGQALEREFGPRRVILMIPGSKPTEPPGRPVQVREEMVTELKRQMESSEIELMPDKEQFKQFRRTKRKADGKIEQGGTKARTHFDRFWASCYASYAINVLRGKRNPYQDHDLIVVTMGGRRGAA